jgi:hypothetical protein
MPEPNVRVMAEKSHRMLLADPGVIDEFRLRRAVDRPRAIEG